MPFSPDFVTCSWGSGLAFNAAGHVGVISAKRQLSFTCILNNSLYCLLKIEVLRSEKHFSSFILSHKREPLPQGAHSEDGPMLEQSRVRGYVAAPTGGPKAAGLGAEEIPPPVAVSHTAQHTWV